MDSQPQASADALIARMRQQFEKLCQDVTQAVNAAEPGRVITDSEEKVRDLLARFRQQTFQAAVQLRLEAAQAALPPPTHPKTGQRLHKKGDEPFSVLTVNGRITLFRRRFFAKKCLALGGSAPTVNLSVTQGDWLIRPVN
jgi:hypothetical protein